MSTEDDLSRENNSLKVQLDQEQEHTSHLLARATDAEEALSFLMSQNSALKNSCDELRQEIARLKEEAGEKEELF